MGFHQGLTMHNTLDCVPDTGVRALMMKDRSNWAYNTYAELKERTKTFRALANCTSAGRMTEVPTTGIKNLFFSHKIGIVMVRPTPRRNGQWKMEIKVPNNGPRVEHYFLWSTATGYSDALAKRVGKDCFKLLWTKKEMADFHKECYPDPSPGNKMWKKQIMWGRQLPKDVKLRVKYPKMVRA